MLGRRPELIRLGACQVEREHAAIFDALLFILALFNLGN